MRGAAFSAPIFALVAAFAVTGCVAYKGAKVVNGTDLAVGMNIPSTEGTLQINFLNYLSGFRLGIEDGAMLDLTYERTNKTTCFGVVEFNETAKITASVSQPVTEAAKNADSSTSAKSGATGQDDSEKPVDGCFSPSSGDSTDVGCTDGGDNDATGGENAFR